MKSRLFLVICTFISLLSFLTPITFAQTPDPYPETIVCDHSPCEVINAERLAGMRQDITPNYDIFLLDPNNTPYIESVGYTYPDGYYETPENSYLTPKTVIIPRGIDLIIPQMGIIWNDQGLSYTPYKLVTSGKVISVVPGNSITTTPDDRPMISSGALIDDIFFVWIINPSYTTADEIHLNIGISEWHILQPSHLPPAPYSFEISPFPNDWRIGEIITINRIYPQMIYMPVDGSNWKIISLSTKAYEITRENGDVIVVDPNMFIPSHRIGNETEPEYFSPIKGDTLQIFKIETDPLIIFVDKIIPPWVDDASKG